MGLQAEDELAKEQRKIEIKRKQGVYINIEAILNRIRLGCNQIAENRFCSGPRGIDSPTSVHVTMCKCLRSGPKSPNATLAHITLGSYVPTLLVGEVEK